MMSVADLTELTGCVTVLLLTGGARSLWTEGVTGLVARRGRVHCQLWFWSGACRKSAVVVVVVVVDGEDSCLSMVQ